MDSDQGIPDQRTELLQDILDCLKRQEGLKDQNHEDHKLDKRRDAFSQICSMYAVIAIFVATLGVAFLTYMRDTFGERPEGTPRKVTDGVVTSCLFSSVLLSISSSIALGFGASPTLILSLPTKDAIRDLGSLMLAMGFPFPSQFREQILNPRRRSEGATPVVFHNLDTHHALTPPPRFRTPWRVVQTAVHFRSMLSRNNRLPRTEFQFVVGMLLVAVVCIFWSLVALAIGVITFAWAEFGRGVAIFITAALILPFTVVGTVAAIYKCTLSRLGRESRALPGNRHSAHGSVRASSPV